MFRTFLLLQCLIAIGLACKCAPVTWKQAFEQAKYVSHVKVNARKTTPDRLSLVYSVHHIELFKNKTGIPGPLKDTIITPASSAACGVTGLKVGQEYLVAGTVANGNELRLITCLAFIVKDSSNAMGALPWDKVTNELHDKLKAANFEDK